MRKKVVKVKVGVGCTLKDLSNGQYLYLSGVDKGDWLLEGALNGGEGDLRPAVWEMAHCHQMMRWLFTTPKRPHFLPQCAR